LNIPTLKWHDSWKLNIPFGGKVYLANTEYSHPEKAGQLKDWIFLSEEKYTWPRINFPPLESLDA
jgi:hypothetical protein